MEPQLQKIYKSKKSGMKLLQMKWD